MTMRSSGTMMVRTMTMVVMIRKDDDELVVVLE
jgi:hypothetical protein